MENDRAKLVKYYQDRATARDSTVKMSTIKRTSEDQAYYEKHVKLARERVRQKMEEEKLKRTGSQSPRTKHKAGCAFRIEPSHKSLRRQMSQTQEQITYTGA